MHPSEGFNGEMRRVESSTAISGHAWRETTMMTPGNIPGFGACLADHSCLTTLQQFVGSTCSLFTVRQYLDCAMYACAGQGDGSAALLTTRKTSLARTMSSPRHGLPCARGATRCGLPMLLLVLLVVVPGSLAGPCLESPGTPGHDVCARFNLPCKPTQGTPHPRPRVGCQHP